MWGHTHLWDTKGNHRHIVEALGQCSRSREEKALLPDPSYQNFLDKAVSLLQHLSFLICKLGIRLFPLLGDKVCLRAKEKECLWKISENCKMLHNCMVVLWQSLESKGKIEQNQTWRLTRTYKHKEEKQLNWPNSICENKHVIFQEEGQ